jgi:urea transport system permease protein
MRITRSIGAALRRATAGLTRKAFSFGAAALVAGLLGASLAPTSGRADAADDVLAKFATDRFPDTEKGIQDLAASGLATGPAMLEALAANQLFFDPASKSVYLKDSSGALLSAKTGAAAEGVPEARLKKVRLNNSVRGAMQTAQGALTLMSPDPARRRSAAETVFKSRDPVSLPLIETALAAEKDAKIRIAFEHARAAIVASDKSQDEIKRLEALDVIKDRGDQDAASLLSSIAAANDGRVKASAEEGAKAIQTRLALWAHVQNIWYGLSLGSVLLLAAIGLAITFGVMGVINMAHGEMVMLGAYTTFVVQEWIRAHNPALFDYSLFIAIPLAFVVTGFIGVIIERTIIRYLYGRPLETLLATFGLSLMLQQAVRSIFGANNREVGAPAFMSGSFDFGALAITSGRMWIIVFAIAVFVGLLLLLRATPFGLRMRAVTQNRRMASAMGIDTNRIDALAFGLGSGIAGIAGVALSQIDNVSPNLGQSYIIDSFMVVVFGGVGNLWGTLVAALSLGIANKFMEPIAGAVLGKILLLVFIILFIQKRPRGLFALKGRAVEA